MLERITHYEPLLPYLEEDIENCLYIYMDLVNGKKENADMDVWVQEERSKPELVLLRYYESFQVYSSNGTGNMAAAVEIMEQFQPKMISGPETVIRAIASLDGGDYQAEYGAVYEICSERRFSGAADVQRAVEMDAAEIARLISMDQKLGGHYGEENLAHQLRSRMRSGTGRSYVIRRDGRIIAHTAAYAETKKYAVVSGTIVHPDYRDKGYYPIISSYIARALKQEGKRSYTFSVTPQMMRYHDKVDRKCGCYGKLTRRTRNHEIVG